MRGVKEKEQIQSLQDETLKSGFPRTSYNLWLVKTQKIHFINFIIWVLWAVTWQKWHMYKIEAQFSKPFYPLPRCNIYSRDTPQDFAENTELGKRKPSSNPFLPWTYCGLANAYTLNLVCPIITAKSLWILHKTVGRRVPKTVFVALWISSNMNYPLCSSHTLILGKSPKLSELWLPFFS